MTIAARCPNPSCGRLSQLGDDPLGRVFRCPRCLTKLPAGGAAGGDSGWTRVLGPLPRRAPAPRPGPARDAFESDEFLAAAFDDEPDDEDESRYTLAAVAPPPPGAGPPGLVGLPAPAPASAARGPCGLGRFQIVGLLGEGRHAAVYRACDPTLQREVALKLPRLGAPRSARAVERFLGEARALARLRHPRIVSVYEAGRDGDQLYIALALIEGRSLAETLADGRLPHRRSAAIVAELAEALAYAHGLGIVHRDVKPANVRLDARGEVHLMDFGIAYRPDAGEPPAPPGTILGTPAYIAPEQAAGAPAAAAPAGDQYSLGAVFHELLCGRPPFSGPPSYVLFHAVHHEPPDPREIDPTVPAPLAEICRRATAKRPERRYPSCQTLADDLKRWLDRGGRRWFS